MEGYILVNGGWERFEDNHVGLLTFLVDSSVALVPIQINSVLAA